MSLLSHTELITLVEEGIIEGVDHDSINATSIDIHLGPNLLVEIGSGLVDYSARGKPNMAKAICSGGYVMQPGEFLLAQSIEVFNLPNDISCEYKLKSSMARIGLEHMNAGWCDAGWNGSVLTLEFKNMLQHHSIQIKEGDAIGQVIFFRHEPVPAGRAYSARGRYNNDKTVSAMKL